MNLTNLSNINIQKNKLYENDKAIIYYPFCTHGGGDSAHIFTDMANLCPDAKMKKGYSCYGSNVETAKKEVEKWLKELKE